MRDIDIEIRSAREEDWPAVRALLEACELPLTGAHEALKGFWLAMSLDGVLVGCAALERHGRSGLLRSVAVSPEWRGRGVATALVASLLSEATNAGLADMTLLTTTAADFFPRFGFRMITREEAPEAMRASGEFREACPETASIMFRALI
jgi:N-acetylglutamate synthase-like GNAT family acetyltransferase